MPSDAFGADLVRAESVVRNEAFGLPRRILTGGRGASLSVFEETVPAGAGPPLHIHRNEDEHFLVLEGRMRFRCNGAELEAGPGDGVLIPAGAPHAFQGLAPSSRALVTLNGPFAGFFLAVEREGLAPPADMARICEIGAAWGIDFVGPPLD
ncbi:MAG: cupin domain-containing protein [Pseudomonadota bacterium]